MQPGHVWVDGQVQAADATHLSVFDRGFQLGDGVFETLRARGGRPTELPEHLARLQRSADGLGLPLPDDVDDVGPISDLVDNILRNQASTHGRRSSSSPPTSVARSSSSAST